MREWIALGCREQLTYSELSKRSGVHVRTLFRWVVRFRAEQALRTAPDRADRPFVQLDERASSPSGELEIVLPDQRRVVVKSAVIVEALARAVTELGRC
jgi:transposase-like protein